MASYFALLLFPRFARFTRLRSDNSQLSYSCDVELWLPDTGKNLG
jgi:hypothetical protein